jgi:hypothetical protein
MAVGALKLGASWLAKKGLKKTVKKAITRSPAAQRVLRAAATKLKSTGAAGAIAKKVGSSKLLKSVSRAAKSITGISSVQKAIQLAKQGKYGRAALAGIGGALGLKFTRDVLTGAVTPAAAATEQADDPFQAEEGAGTEQPSITGPPSPQPLWDAPDILPDFIEERLETLTPAQAQMLGIGAAGLGTLGLGAVALAKKEQILDMLGLGDGTTITVPTIRAKKAKKAKTIKGPSFKTLGKEWKKLSKADKAMYENKFSDYVKVQKDMRSAAKTPQTRPVKKPTGKNKKPGTQQNRMKAAAKKWKRYTGKMSYQEFMSKELKK